MKTIIEDVVLKMEGGKETELHEGASIRFEIGNTSLSCTLTEEGVEVYKVNNVGMEESRVVVIPLSSNKILIK